MYGVWFAGFMKPQPITITISTIETLVTTMMLLTIADSCMPRMSSSRQDQQDDDRGHVHDARARPSGDSPRSGE